MAPRTSVGPGYGLDDLVKDTNWAREQHMLYWRNPVANAYSDAFNAVKSTIEQQQAADKARAELFASLISLAVTIPVGGWMTARLGHATLSKAAGNASLRLVLKANQRGLYRAADFVLDSEPAQYMLGKAFGEVVKKIDKSVVSAAASGLTKNPFQASMDKMKSEMKFFLELDTWVRAHSSFLLTMEKKIRASSLSTADKDGLAAIFGRSRFISDAPMSTKVPSHKKASEALELALWMGVLMSMDYKETSHWVYTGNSGHTEWRNAGGIKEMPSDAAYPKEKKGSHFGGGGVRVSYKTPGKHVLQRVEELYGTYVGGKFLQGTGTPHVYWMESLDGFNAGELHRAEKAIPILARKFPIS